MKFFAGETAFQYEIIILEFMKFFAGETVFQYEIIILEFVELQTFIMN